MDKLNRDGNLLGRVCALAVIAVAVAGLSRVCGVEVCPMSSGGHCVFSR